MIAALRKLVALFTPSQKRVALVLVVLMFGGMLLETLGVGMVIPALMLLTRADLAERIPALSRLVVESGITNPEALVAIGMGAMAAVYTFKCFYVAFVTSRQMRFVYEVQADLSRRLFVRYLYKPYSFHLQRNSSLLVRNVVNATNELTLTGLVSSLILFTEFLVLIGISTLLLWIEPVGALVAAGFLAAFGFVMNQTTRKGIRRAGEALQVHEEMRIRYLQQAIGGAKELKLLGRERGAVQQYLPHNEASARIGQKLATLQALPKLWLELLAVLGLVVLVLALIWQGKPTDGLVPTIGMFAAAAFRLIPSMNRILGSVQLIRQSTPVIEILHSELVEVAETPLTDSDRTEPLSDSISLVDVSVRYPLTETSVIEGVSFSIQRGTTVGLIGGSGAGKSTLVDAILGLLPVERGKILADGHDIQANLRGWQDQVGYVPQSIYLTDDTIRRNIAFGLPDSEIDDNAVRRAIAAAQLVDLVEQSPLGSESVVGERGVRLSGGQRQRIGIARALYHNPTVLVLDEATSSLDIATEAEVMQAINALHGEKTILIVTHRLNTLDHCDRIFRVENGGVVELADTRSCS